MPDPTTTADAVDTVVGAASEAARAAAASAPEDRVRWLNSVADHLDDSAGALVPLAVAETNLPAARLTGEVARTTAQLRLFAQVCLDGGLHDVVVDHADADATPVPRPDVRRTVIPLGPVAVFAAGNFPFAFGVAGGDTASAFAAGCPVVVKAHPGYPQLSDRTAEIVHTALAAAGAPAGLFGLVHGLDEGRRLVVAPGIRAVGFTGSVRGGRALFDLACSRPEPIAFYGELGSVNPVVVTRGVAQARAEDVANGFVASTTLGTGQLCTKPGLLLVPAGSPVPQLAADAADAVTLGPMLGTTVQEAFDRAVARLCAVADVTRLTAAPANGELRPVLLRASAADFLRHRDALLEEAFGPASIVVEYGDDDELLAAIGALSGALAAGVFAAGDEPVLPELVAALVDRVGRVVWNGWPTGVAVTWGMHHGGPYPATTSVSHTSVGATAVRRWLRPVAFQDWPAHLLPSHLRDGSHIPARVDGAFGRL